MQTVLLIISQTNTYSIDVSLKNSAIGPVRIGKNSAYVLAFSVQHEITTMWANDQRNGRPAEHRWRPLFNAAKFG